MRDGEMQAICECVIAAVNSTATQAIEHIAERHAQVAREVAISLSPLEKFLKQPVCIETRDWAWEGELIGFGPGWLEIEHARQGRVIVHTGVGMSVRPCK